MSAWNVERIFNNLHPPDSALKALLRWWVETLQTRTPALGGRCPSPLSLAAGAGGSTAGCALCCPGAGAGRKLSGACLLFILATRCCSSAVACRPKFNAQMTPPSSPCARRLLGMRDCTTEQRGEHSYFLLNLFCMKHSSWGWALSFLWRGSQRILRGRSSFCSAAIRARLCPQLSREVSSSDQDEIAGDLP